MTPTTDGVNWTESRGLQVGNHDLSNPADAPPNTPPEGIVVIVNRKGDFPAGGLLRFTQVISKFNAYRYDSTYIHGDKIETDGVDTNPEYPFTFSAPGADYGMNDSPAAGYKDDTVRIRLATEFTTWLMFRTGDADSQWVPLRSLDWKGGGQADKTANSSWTVSGQYAQSFVSTETTVFPIWDHRENLSWQSF